MSCNPQRRPFSRIWRERITTPRGWALILLGMGSLVLGALLTGPSGTTLIALGPSIIAFGIVLPIAKEATVGPEGLKVSAAQPDVRDSFHSFIKDEGDGIQRFAGMLTARGSGAAALVSGALARAANDWAGVLDSEREVFVLCCIVQLALRRASFGLLERPDPSSPAAADEDARRMLACLSTLSLTERALLLLNGWENLSVEETARIMGLSTQSATVAIESARLHREACTGASS